MLTSMNKCMECGNIVKPVSRSGNRNFTIIINVCIITIVILLIVVVGNNEITLFSKVPLLN